MHIEEFKDVNQVAPHANEHEKRGITIDHSNGDFRKAILEMSVILTKYVCLADLRERHRPVHHQTTSLHLSATLPAPSPSRLVLRTDSVHQRGEQHRRLHRTIETPVGWTGLIIRWAI
jgi:hypothetical protein